MKKDVRIYLEEILARITQIEEFTHGGEKEFLSSKMIQEAVIRCFEVIGEITKRLPQDLLDQYPNIPWRQIYSFRNYLIHQYDEIELSLVWAAIESDLQPLKVVVNDMLEKYPESDSE